MGLGLAAVVAANFIHVHDPAFFAVGVAPPKSFVIMGPSGVGSLNIVRVVSAASEADAFAVAPAAQAEGFALGTEVVRWSVLPKDVAS